MNQVALLYRKFWRNPHYRYAMMIAVMLLFTTAVALAQTDTPVPPTAVPSTAIPQIDIPTGELIGSLNGWLAIFGPIILFIGMIPVALGLLQYVIRMFRQAFGGGN